MPASIESWGRVLFGVSVWIFEFVWKPSNFQKRLRLYLQFKQLSATSVFLSSHSIFQWNGESDFEYDPSGLTWCLMLHFPFTSHGLVNLLLQHPCHSNAMPDVQFYKSCQNAKISNNETLVSRRSVETYLSGSKTSLHRPFLPFLQVKRRLRNYSCKSKSSFHISSNLMHMHLFRYDTCR